MVTANRSIYNSTWIAPFRTFCTSRSNTTRICNGTFLWSSQPANESENCYLLCNERRTVEQKYFWPAPRIVELVQSSEWSLKKNRRRYRRQRQWGQLPLLEKEIELGNTSKVAVLPSLKRACYSCKAAALIRERYGNITPSQSHQEERQIRGYVFPECLPVI